MTGISGTKEGAGRDEVKWTDLGGHCKEVGFYTEWAVEPLSCLNKSGVWSDFYVLVLDHNFVYI